MDLGFRAGRTLAGLVFVLVAMLFTPWLQGCGAGATDTTQPSGTTAGETDPDSGLPWVEESALPPEAVETLRLIDAGGPFPYDQDGSTFGNFEGLLPDRDGGYYKEYTVETPGSEDRGARRIVAGSGGEFYYTEDHYESFRRIQR